MTLHALQQDPRYEVVALLTTLNRDYRRIVMHGVREDVLDAQAAALGLPLDKLWLPVAPDNSAYEAVMREAMLRWQAKGVHHVAFGDLFLEDVRDYRIAQLARVGMEGVFPLFGSDTRQLARHLIREGFKAKLSCVDGSQLPAHFAGRDFDSALLADLPAGVDPCGENGEFHSCIEAGPIFRQPLRVRRGESVTRDSRFHYVDLLLDD